MINSFLRKVSSPKIFKACHTYTSTQIYINVRWRYLVKTKKPKPDKQQSYIHKFIILGGPDLLLFQNHILTISVRPTKWISTNDLWYRTRRGWMPQSTNCSGLFRWISCKSSLYLERFTINNAHTQATLHVHIHRTHVSTLLVVNIIG